jgi:hexulose-6-phosphate isomerase
MTQEHSRRTLLIGSLAAAAGAARIAIAGKPLALVQPELDMHDRGIFKSLKLGMFNEEIPLLGKFKFLKEVGFDGVELDAPHGPDPGECLAASEQTGLLIDGNVNDRHWQIRMSSPDEATRDQAVEIMLQAIRQCWQVRGDTVLLVPGHGQDGSQETIADRAEAAIRRCLPLAGLLGVTIAIENVWNHMFYDHEGPADQSADALAAFIDRFDSPLVGVQFDIGNHQKYGRPAEWIRTLGRRIVKLDVKDWSVEKGFCEIGEGDVDWPAVREALAEIQFTGWAAAEVGGGDRERMKVISGQMDEVLGL